MSCHGGASDPEGRSAKQQFHTGRCARASGDPCVSAPPLAAAATSKPVDPQPSTPPALSGKSSDGSESEEVPPKKRRLIPGASE